MLISIRIRKKRQINFFFKFQKFSVNSDLDDDDDDDGLLDPNIFFMRTSSTIVRIIFGKEFTDRIRIEIFKKTYPFKKVATIVDWIQEIYRE